MDTLLSIWQNGVIPILGFLAIFFIIYSLSPIANSLKKIANLKDGK